MRHINLLAAIFAGCLLSTAHAATITADFDNGTAQGWMFTSGGGVYDVLTGGPGPGPQAGSHRVRPVNWGTRDGAHTTMIFRSPGFTLDGSGNLTFYLSGGEGNGPSQGTPPANETDIAPTTGAAGVHWQGVGLRNVITGDYVLTGQKTAQGDAWQQVTFTSAQLAPYVDQVFTLDFIDSRQGSWGWNQLDTVAIPGVFLPEPATAGLAMLAVCGLVARRRRR